MGFENADLMSLDTHTDNPEPLYEWLREEAPLYFDEKNELWAVSRYDDVLFVSKHTEIFSSSQGVVPKITQEDWPDEAMINLDGDAHTCQRGLVSKGFTPRRIANLEAHAKDIVTELIDNIIDKGECDVVLDLARLLPMRIIGEMLGYPKEKHEEILGWADSFTHAGCGPDHITEEVAESFGNFAEYHEELLEEKRQCPGEDLLSIWLNAELDGQKLSEDKLLFEHNLVLVGGSETTRNATSAGLLALMRNPDQFKALREDPSLLDRAVEEMIRWATPFVRMARTLTQDYEMHGKTMKEGQEIIMLYPAANRDPRAFDDPQVFDILRERPNPHVSFGYGRHFCLGASLARLEIRVMMEAILTRLPEIRLKPNTVPLAHPSCFIRGLKTLPVEF
jgi:cholest-4-en-3-one 26-monooxygenase